MRYPCSAVQLKLIMATLATCRGTSLIRNNPFPRTLQQDYTQGPTVVIGEGALSYEQGTLVGATPQPRGHSAFCFTWVGRLFSQVDKLGAHPSTLEQKRAQAGRTCEPK